jgi:hypothetical protein
VLGAPLIVVGLGVGLIFIQLARKLAGKLSESSLSLFSTSAARGEIVKGMEQNPPADTLSWPPESTWVSMTIDGIDYLVSPTYLGPIGIGEAFEIAKAHGFVVPTPRMVDAIWQAADLKLDPHPQAHDGTLAMMNSRAITDNQNAHIENQVGGRAFSLLGGTHKDVVVVDRAWGNAVNKPGIYGWHRTSGKVIQDPMWGHALSWKDYSQGLRLIKRV